MIRIAVASLGAIALGWLAIAAGLGAALARSQPAQALAWAPWNGDAAARTAMAEVQRSGAATPQDRLVELTTTAIRRDPSRSLPYTALGLIADVRGDKSRARLLIAHSDRLTRRDLPAQLWLIEDAVARDDVPAALRHYDQALRTDPAATPLLLPILVAATDDTRLLEPIARLLSRDPPWREQFLGRVIETARSPRAAFRLAAGHLGTGSEFDKNAAVLLVERLVRDGAYPLAWRAYEHLSPSGTRDGALVRNGGFALPVGRYPFDWLMASGVDLSADLRPRTGSDLALFANASGADAGGEVARQLILLEPGRYRVSFDQAGQRGVGRSAFSPALDCAGSAQPLRVDQGTGDFAVPAAGCGAQWLRILVGRDAKPLLETAWIDDIRIAPR